MRAIDTNVLVRLIARDHARQTAAAEAFIANGAWVSLLALAETVWVLDTVYELNKIKPLVVRVRVACPTIVLAPPKTVADCPLLARALAPS